MMMIINVLYRQKRFISVHSEIDQHVGAIFRLYIDKDAMKIISV